MMKTYGQTADQFRALGEWKDQLNITSTGTAGRRLVLQQIAQVECTVSLNKNKNKERERNSENQRVRSTLDERARGKETKERNQ